MSEILAIIALAANYASGALLVRGYIDYKNKKYNDAFFDLLFCLALATLFNVKITT